MKQRLSFLWAYLAFWVVFFVLARGVFLAYQYPQTLRLDGFTVLGIFLYGLRMDLAVASYIAVIPFALAAAAAFLPDGAAARLTNTFTAAIAAVVAFLTTVDLELFSAWGFRLDATPLRFLDSPKGMLISASDAPIVLLVAILAGLSAAAILGFRRWVLPRARTAGPRSLGGRTLSFLSVGLLTALLFFPARGGFQLTSINQSFVYFSRDDFANQAALNVTWNFFNSLRRSPYETTNPYQRLPPAEARTIVDSLLQEPGRAPRLLRGPAPNVILVIWESLTAKAVERLGGMAGVTPELEALIPEGVLFDRFYATGNRTDKGLVAILSGYPPQPKASIIKIPHKVARLPQLSRDFAGAGYHTAFYYGSELVFANKKSYLLAGGFDRIVEKDAFDRADWNSKWGAHDHVVLDRLLAEVGLAPQPFFAVALTLSSHEPFEAPVPKVFPGSDKRARFLNALHYTDRSVGAFIREAKRQPWWDNTLIVITSDHGHRLLAQGPEPHGSPAAFRVPMLWLGGALAVRDTVIGRVGSHADLAPTLLRQAGLARGDYRWGKDFLSPGAVPFAHYAFNDGFGFVDSAGAVVFNNVDGGVLLEEGTSPARLRAGLAYQQLAYRDYLDR